ncbi:MAG: hypothetical protein WCV90_05360 [Candidatus Woesearchaeota archaeon]|jgi:hypothetical protein
MKKQTWEELQEERNQRYLQWWNKRVEGITELIEMNGQISKRDTSLGKILLLKVKPIGAPFLVDYSRDYRHDCPPTQGTDLQYLVGSMNIKERFYTIAGFMKENRHGANAFMGSTPVYIDNDIPERVRAIGAREFFDTVFRHIWHVEAIQAYNIPEKQK